MPVPIVADPILDEPLTLVRFTIEVWLHRLLVERPLYSTPAMSQQGRDAMLARIASDEQELDRYLRALQGLDTLLKPKPTDAPVAPSSNAGKRVEDPLVLVRELVRTLDDHLVRTRPRQRVHLVSFFDSSAPDVTRRPDWVDPSAFFSAWAAGSPRSKYEVLDRGRQAAALVSQRGDNLRPALGTIVSPASPYRRNVTLQKLLEETVAGLLGVLCLPASSGGPAASRYLAAIGGISLTEMERYIFGEPSDEPEPASFGTPGGWRLVRVLAVIGQLYRREEVAAAVWGKERAVEVRDEALRILRRVLAEEVPVVSRERSLPVEAFRELDEHGELYEVVERRLKFGRIVDEDGTPNAPFGELGLLGTREQAYTALVMAEKRPERVPEIARLLRARSTTVAFGPMEPAVRAARHYAAAYIEHRFGRNGERGSRDEWRVPPLDAFVSEELLSQPTGTPDVPNVCERVRTWFDSDGSGTKVDPHVSAAAFAVWDALRSAADAYVDGRVIADAWRRKGRHVARTSGRRFAVDGIFDDANVPVHARHAVRSLVAQTVLSPDGTSRREGIEALRQAGMDDVAARLFALVVARCRAESERLGPDVGHGIDHLRDQAVFCLSYTGSLASFDTLFVEAGMTTGRDESSRRRAEWGPLPGVQPAHLAWVRTTALLGLADLGDQLHDATGDEAKARIEFLLLRIEERLRQMAGAIGRPVLGERDGRGRQEDRLVYLQGAEERRALVSVLAMLRSEEARSINLLHVLSGSTYDVDPDEKKMVVNAPRVPSHVAKDEVGDDVVFRWKPMSSKQWRETHDQLAPIDDGWDLVCWQLAQWGLARIERRFTNTPGSRADEEAIGDGVRITDPLSASRRAERRMRDVVGYATGEARTERMPTISG